ncbi:phytanoyl-CoA dioxygenase [Siphonobacter sp. BAB-5385]|uniref:phytanoyl-CoA dioxygenase family protein n=1 Tax=Siphonobacter sp. BAB-5385 TaxID=1864822 RepID=UPI000B9E1521|nr:phytanoyl-CoA dioxygenase family protein [Siphonobacter sp. BAB-5385]OZI06113.1 phytanoyl-CoA dioxygenase [Siphonobacter sp. BAB-5385]
MHQTFVFNNALTDEQRRYFQHYGIIQFKQFIDRATVQEFIREVNRVEHRLLKTQTEKVNGIPLKFGENERGERMIQRLAFTSHYSQTLRDFLKDPRLQLLLELLGPYEGRIGEHEKDGLVVNHYVNTPTSQFKQLGWHTDSPRDLFLGTRIQPMLNVGLHLDDCPQSNGGLRVLAGTHEQSIWKLLFRKKYFIDNQPDPKEVGFDIEAGDLTIHDGRLWHRVQQSPFIGERSRRRVMYIPIITGAYSPKHAESPTPFYHTLGSLKFPKPTFPGGSLWKNWQPGLARFLS